MRGFGINDEEQSYNLLSKMLIMDPKKRIKTEEVLDHKYFSDYPHPTRDVFSCFNQIPFPCRKYLATKKSEPIKFEPKARLIRKNHLQARNI